MSFRGRFVGAISAVNLATLAVAFVAIGVLVDASQERQFDDALRRESLEEVAEIADSGGRRLRISPRAGPSPDDIGPLTKYAVLYAEDGAILDVTESWMGRPPALSDLSSTTCGSAICTCAGWSRRSPTTRARPCCSPRRAATSTATLATSGGRWPQRSASRCC
jgi:hypothetical protein